MTPSVSPGALDSAADPAFAAVLEELTNKCLAGENVDWSAFLEAHAEHAAQLRALLPAMQAVADLGRSAGKGDAVFGDVLDGTQEMLGDFRILREIGRGGMGVVYEAEQVSLGRRVALKVLPFAGVLDPRQLQRFRNEAHAAACLTHPGIVPVYYVGCERAVHFYAMQYIEGQSLADVLGELRSRARPQPAAGSVQGADGQAPQDDMPVEQRPAPSTVQAGAFSTRHTLGGREYFRAVAHLGAQAAQALDYAHELGIVHRDIKPANLLLDAQGHLWVTDFGLAQVQKDPGLTLTGDLLGTLRYMSPEQALAKRALVDHRTDVYSLGATLYELLTLEPVITGSDREELLRQIASEAPKPLRRYNKAIPGELETIVLKALEKNPVDRYASAAELAEDLERFVRDEPIRARRPSLARRLRGWSRRHKGLVGLVVAVLVMAAVFAGGSWLWWVQMRASAEGEGRAALREAAGLLEKERWPEALSAARRAQGVLAGVGADPDLRRQASTLIVDLEMAQRLQEARLQGTAVHDGHYDDEATDAAYGAAFREYGIDVDVPDTKAVADQVQARSIHRQLVAALDDWAFLRWRLKGKGWKQRLAVARVADPDVGRNRLRDIVEGKDEKTLEEAVAAANWSDQNYDLLVRLARRIPVGERTVALLVQAQQQHPDNFWINDTLGHVFTRLRPPRLDEVVRYFSIAAALRPESPGVHLNLGPALASAGRPDAAIAECYQAIRLNKDYAEAHCNLGYALRLKARQGQVGSEYEKTMAQAIAAYREAIQLKKSLFEAHGNLGVALAETGKLEEAIAEYQEAIRLSPTVAGVHLNLGQTLAQKGQLQEAADQYREAIHLTPDFAEAHFELANLLRNTHRREDAIAEYRQVIRLSKNDHRPHINLGALLRAMDRVDEAIAENREAIRLNKDSAEAHCNLGLTLADRGQFREAAEEIRLGHELGARNPRWPYPSARWLQFAQIMADLDARLPTILMGKAQPKNNIERLYLAHLCEHRARALYASAARFFGEAFDKQANVADDLNVGHRYNAACAAALAGCGKGKDADVLDPKQRADLRKQALAWLRADLNAYRQVMEKSAGKAGAEVAQRMQHWMQDNDFAGVRGAKSIGTLPEAERGDWQKLWEDVEALRQRAAQLTQPARAARP